MNLNAMLSQFTLLEKFNKAMQWGTRYFPDFFAYSVDISAGLAAGAQATAVVQIQSDGSFVLTDMSGTAKTANTVLAAFGNQEFVDVTVQITDSGSGRNFFDKPIPFNHLFGQAGGQRYQLPVPKIIQNNSNVTFTFTNNGTIAVTRLYVTMFGTKALNK